MSQKFLNHTAFRIADPKRSISFYERNFGMQLLKTQERNDIGFSYYLLGLTGPNSRYQQEPFYNRGGLLQLVHKHGSTPDNFKANNGNVEPHRGFGHICFSVSDIEGTCKQLEANKVEFKKRLTDGRQKNIAFALDPDNYWIELISHDVKQSGDSNARLNHSMIRIKDKDATLEFYTKKLGMSLVHKMDFPEAEFTLFFLSFDPSYAEKHGFAFMEGLIELTYNYGSEKDEKLSYHTGNSDPVGFSHFAISVEEPQTFVNQLKIVGVNVIHNFGEGKGRYHAKISDPDGYVIDVLPTTDYTVTGKI